MARVRVLYFASVRDAIGLSEEQVCLPEQSDDRSLLVLLAQRHPVAARLIATSRLAVEQEFAQGAVRLQDDAELAVIPPVSGG